jgi:hypothetical protein
LQFDQKKYKKFSAVFFLFLVIKTLDPVPDPDLLEMLDPDPYPDLINPDPQHCFLCSWCKISLWIPEPGQRNSVPDETPLHISRQHPANQYR